MKEFIKKWFNRENWKLSIALITIGLLSIYTAYITISYFKRNEILLGISDKYVTTEEDSIKDIIDTSHIYSEFNQNVKEKNIFKINDSTTIYLSNNYPIKHRIEKNEKESFELGDIGDFIGGYFGFLIGVIGALLTFLAFYIQYKANKDVQEQFRLQQFETQFHKMIDVYLNNKDKFSIIGYKNPKNKEVIITGQKLKEKCNFNNISIINGSTGNTPDEVKFIEYITKDHIVFQKLLVELKVINRVLLEAFKQKFSKTESELTDKNKKKIFIDSYNLFIVGLNKFEKDKRDKKEFNGYIKISIKALKKIRDKNREDGSKRFIKFYKNKDGKNKNLWVKLNYEPFKGYLHFLPQYYRNIYSIVKFVVNQNQDLNLSQQQKEDYLKILRSTMSEYEQALLFYNWYSGMGSSWEDNENKFFTKYKMIHNMKKITLIDQELDIYNILQIPVNEQSDFFENY